MKTLLAAVLVALALPAAAAAHANLVRTEPANGAVVARGPAAVRVVFDDTVRAGPGVEAVRNGGSSVLAGRARVEGGRTLVVPLRPGLPQGDYSVRWSIISDDGHLESGVLAFAVGTGRAPPQATLSPEATGPSPATVATRWILFAGLLGAVGIALFALVARPPDEERVALTLATACALLAVGAGNEAHRVGLETRDGRVLLAGLVAAVVLALAAAAATLERRALRPALLLAPLLALVPSLAGHALDPGLSHVNVVADVLHVLGASAWVGALLGLVLFRAREARLAVGGLLLLGVTGVVRASFELTAASQLWDTAYGRALLAKTALLLVAVAVAVVLRRGVVELAVVAVLVVAVSVLVQERPGRNAPRRVAAASAFAEPSPPPPAPPPDAVVVAQEAGPYGVALASERARRTVIVLSPAGGGASGLDVRVDGRATTACGSGCYRAGGRHGLRSEVSVDGRSMVFELPALALPGSTALRGIARTFRGSRSVEFVERLASDPTHVVVARWRLEAPNRIAYTIPGGAQGIVIGPRRWDRASPAARWVESPQTPLPQPALPWTRATNVRWLDAHHLVFADPSIPAYFELTYDRRPTELHMVASAHFMTDRYLRFDAPRAIRPPR